MTTHQTAEINHSVFDTCDPQYLRGLREAAGMDLLVLARTACLSVAQVRQLETETSDSLFYSDAIKRQAYKRLLLILGAEPPTVELPQGLRDADKAAIAHLNTLDQIVSMSEQPFMHRPWSGVVHTWFAKLNAYKQVLTALFLMALAGTLLISNHGQTSSNSARTSVSSSNPQAMSMSIEAPVVPASGMIDAAAPVVAASTSIPAQVGVCAYVSESMPELKAFVAQKEGRYVYLVSSADVDVCVVDGSKQATIVQLKAGESRSVYGASPWQVSSSQLQKIQIYFQGGRVSLPDAVVHQVKLTEMPVAR